MELLAAGLGSLVLLAVVFVPLERVFAARAQPVLRPAFGVDLLFFAGQYLLWNTAAIALLQALDGALADHGPGALRTFAAAQPFWLQALAAVLLGDFFVYWFHRACHTFDVLWRFHAVHHSSTQLDWLAAHREHPVDGLCTQLCANLPAFLLGFDVLSLGALAAFRGMWSIFIHANVRLPLGPLRWLLGAPELHHWHHAKVERTTHNFANTAPWLDLLFRTHHLPDPALPYELGIAQPWPRGYLAQLVRPLPFGGALAARLDRWAPRRRRRTARAADATGLVDPSARVR